MTQFITSESKVYVPTISNKIYAVKQLVSTPHDDVSLFILCDNDTGQIINHEYFFDKYGYLYNGKTFKLEDDLFTNVVFQATESNRNLLNKLYGIEFEECKYVKENILIELALEYFDYVPCIFSNSIPSEELTKENCDTFGYVKELPNSSNLNRFLNVADKKLYKYATILDVIYRGD